MYRVDIKHISAYTFKATSSGNEFTIEAKGEGVSPPSALLASLGSCMGVYIRKYAEGAGLALDNFSLSLEADFSQEPPVSFKEIRVLIDLRDSALDIRRQKALLDFIKNCPVHNTLKSNPAIIIQLKQQ